MSIQVENLTDTEFAAKFWEIFRKVQPNNVSPRRMSKFYFTAFYVS